VEHLWPIDILLISKTEAEDEATSELEKRKTSSNRSTKVGEENLEKF
jgi:hypothetical protein